MITHVVNVPGEPRAVQSVRFGRGRAYKPKAHKEWIAKVRLYASAAVGNRPMTPGAVRVDILAEYKRPRRERAKKQWPSRTDADNTIKGILDGLKGIVFEDDRDVTDVRFRKAWALKGSKGCLTVVVQEAETPAEPESGERNAGAPRLSCEWCGATPRTLTPVPSQDGAAAVLCCVCFAKHQAGARQDSVAKPGNNLTSPGGIG